MGAAGGGGTYDPGGVERFRDDVRVLLVGMALGRLVVCECVLPVVCARA